MLVTQAPSSQNGAAAKGSVATKVRVSAAKTSKKWALPESEFAEGVVGGKSRNLAALRNRLPADIALPASVALPFGTFERVLADKANSGVAAEVKKLLKALEKTTGMCAGLSCVTHVTRFKTHILRPKLLHASPGTSSSHLQLDVVSAAGHIS